MDKFCTLEILQIDCYKFYVDSRDIRYPCVAFNVKFAENVYTRNVIMYYYEVRFNELFALIFVFVNRKKDRNGIINTSTDELK